MTATVEINNADWLEWRRQGIGASDIAAVLNLSPWTSPWSLWADKCGLLPQADVTEAMEFGHRMELAVGPWFQDVTGLHVSAQQEQRVHPEDPIARCTLDGLVYEDSGWINDTQSINDPALLGGLEIKTAQAGPKWDEIPTHYQTQAQWQMYVCQLDRVYFAVLMGRRLDVHILERDQEDIDTMVSAAHDFWNQFVVTGTPPPVDGHNATIESISQVFPNHTPGVSVEFDGRVAAYHTVYRDLKEREKQMSHALNEAQAVLACALESAEIATINGQQVLSWKTQETKRIDTTLLRAEQPEIAKQYTKKSTSRVMRIHTPKGS